MLRLVLPMVDWNLLDSFCNNFVLWLHPLILQCEGDDPPTTTMDPEQVFSFYQSARGTHLKNLKVIVSVREPIARELSMYNHQLSRYNANPDPKEWYATIVMVNGTIKTFDRKCDHPRSQ